MILALYSDALQIIKMNKTFIFLYLLSFLSSVPRSSEVQFSLWTLCGSAPVTLFLGLFLELYMIGMVFRYKNPINQVDSPSRLARKYIWKSLLVGVVTLFWVLIILGLPYVLIDVVRELVSGIFLWSINFIWCIVLNLITFGLFNIGMIILATTNSLALESPALGLLEMYRNFRYYLKVYMFTVLISYTPVIVSVLLLAFREGLGSLIANTSFSFNPYESVFGLLFDSGAKFIFVLVFTGLYMIQKVVMTLSYFSRPELNGRNLVKSVLP